MKKNETDKNYTHMTRRIGSTTYKVKVVFSDTGQETMEDKVLRMICNDMLEKNEKRGIMDMPQMSRPA